LFLDYYTNTRFTLDQELEADLFALRIMKETGLFKDFTPDLYKQVLVILEQGNKSEDISSLRVDTKLELLRVIESQFKSISNVD
jgi:hypothetical protein